VNGIEKLLLLIAVILTLIAIEVAIGLDDIETSNLHVVVVQTG